MEKINSKKMEIEGKILSLSRKINQEKDRLKKVEKFLEKFREKEYDLKASIANKLMAMVNLEKSKRDLG